MQKLPASTHYHVVFNYMQFEGRMANYGPQVFHDNFQNLGCGILLSVLNIFAKLIRVRIWAQRPVKAQEQSNPEGRVCWRIRRTRHSDAIIIAQLHRCDN